MKLYWTLINPMSEKLFIPCMGKKFRSYHDIPCIGKTSLFPCTGKKSQIRNSNDKASQYKVNLVLVIDVFTLYWIPKQGIFVSCAVSHVRSRVHKIFYFELIAAIYVNTC